MRSFQNSLFLLSACTLQLSAATDYTVAYTGRSFGYYRIPDVQRSSGNVCDASAVDLDQVREILREIHSAGDKNVLVSLGDNFSPDLHARSLLQNGSLAPKDQLTFDYLNGHGWVWYSQTTPDLDRSLARGEGVIDFDNVGCFFRLAGFDAIVPGKHDFHFGPERLRELARYLADPAGPGKPVQMLAANLTIATTLANPPAKTEPAPKPQNYAMAGPNGARVKLPDVPLPYLREFEIDNGLDLTGVITSSGGTTQLQKLTAEGILETGHKVSITRYSHAWFCSGELPQKFDLAGCAELRSRPPRDRTLVFELPLDKFALYPSPTALKAGIDYHVCASSSDAPAQMTAANTICHATFQFHHPLLQWGSGKQPNPKLYAAVEGEPVVVFGVVDPALITQIGDLNESWVNENLAYDTRIEIGDPHSALSQALQTCEQDPACVGKRRVLLAQMPLVRAQRLAAHLQGSFDCVIAQSEEGSASATFMRTDKYAVGETPKPLVLVPAPNLSTTNPQALQVSLQTAHIEISEAARSIDNQLRRTAVPVKQENYTGELPLWRLMVSAGLANAPAKSAAIDARAIVQSGILTVMRRYCKADIAFLQHRDLYRPERFAIEQPAAAELQDLLDRLLWKGDFIQCRPATGQALKEAKSDSDRFDSGEKDELNEEGEQGRGLVTLGMFQDPPTENFVASGAFMQDAHLYSIATTDFLALGGTGYPALQNPAVHAATRMENAREFEEISALVCQELLGAVPGRTSGRQYCREPLAAQTYLDSIEMPPYSIPRRIDEAEKLKDFARDNWQTRNLLAPIARDSSELQAQNRRVLSLRLDRADLGYQRNLHSLSETLQQERFSGVQAAEPTAPERFDWVADYLLRLTSYGKNVDRFMQADAEYESSGVKQTFASTDGQGHPILLANEPYQLSLPKNSVGAEIGIETRLFPAHQKNNTGLRLLTSARFETELQAPFIQFQASDGFVKETLPRRNSLFGKGGLRYDGAKSWIEMGVQSGPYTQISALKLGALTCDPGNLALCLSATGTIPNVGAISSKAFSVTSMRRDQSGVFLNARLHVPLLLKKFDYVIDNSGSLFFNRHGDSAADTRYLEVMTHSLTIPVIGNFSIAPKVEIFFFQNKVAGWHIHGYQTSITAQYRFDWHTGLLWRDAFRYPNPPPAQ